MKYKYDAFFENCPEPFDYKHEEEGKSIKELVTIKITIQLERDKYDKKRLKQNLAEKIYKLFK